LDNYVHFSDLLKSRAENRLKHQPTCMINSSHSKGYYFTKNGPENRLNSWGTSHCTYN